MEQPERLQPDDPILRSPETQEYFRSLERGNSDLKEQLKEFNREAEQVFLSDERLIERFRGDANEYHDFLVWFARTDKWLELHGRRIDADALRSFREDLDDADKLDILEVNAEVREEIFRKMAANIRRLRSNLTALGANRDFLSEKNYERWKKIYSGRRQTGALGE